MTSALSRRLGLAVVEARTRRGISLAEAAALLKVSPETFRRIEMGRQDLSLEAVERLETILRCELLTLGSSTPRTLIIEGGSPLRGQIGLPPSMESSLACTFASTLNRGPSRLPQMVYSAEYAKTLPILTKYGVSITATAHGRTEVRAPPTFPGTVTIDQAPSPWIALLIASALDATRQRILYPFEDSEILTNVLQAFGVSAKIEDDVLATEPTNRDDTGQRTVVLRSDPFGRLTATALVAAARMLGVTIIRNAATTQTVLDVGAYLLLTGAEVTGLGTPTVRVRARPANPAEIDFDPGPDPQVALAVCCLCLLNNDSQLSMGNLSVDQLAVPIEVLKEFGAKISWATERGGVADLTVTASSLFAHSDKICSMPGPAILPTWLPLFVPVAARCEGATMIHEWMLDEGMQHLSALARFGVRMTQLDKHRIIVTGRSAFRPATVRLPPNPDQSLAYLITAAAARGTSVLRDADWLLDSWSPMIDSLVKLGVVIDTPQ